MPTDAPFSHHSDFVTSAEELERITGAPLPQIIAKELPALDQMCRDFIAKSTFCLIASANPGGYLDISPRGDPEGFVQVLSDNLIALPDRPRQQTGRYVSQCPAGPARQCDLLCSWQDGDTAYSGQSAHLRRPRPVEEHVRE